MGEDGRKIFTSTQYVFRAHMRRKEAERRAGGTGAGGKRESEEKVRDRRIRKGEGTALELRKTRRTSFDFCLNSS